jgi:hypothetical protein
LAAHGEEDDGRCGLFGSWAGGALRSVMILDSIAFGDI